MRTKNMHSVAQHREDNEFLKQNAELLFKYRELIRGHAWFPYVPVPLQIPGIRLVPLGALLELAGDSSEEFRLLCEDAAWWEPIVMDRIPDKLEVVTASGIDIESPSSLFQSSKSPMEERSAAEQAVIRNRIRALSKLCMQYSHADAIPPKADLREVVSSLKRAGRLPYLTDDQLTELRGRLRAFDVYESLDKMENSLVNDFLEEVVSSCRDGACVTLRPEHFQYFWLQVRHPAHFTAHYAKDRNVCVFTEWAGTINSYWTMRRAQEEYLKALYVSRFDAIRSAVEEAVKDEPELQIENFNPETYTFSLVHRANRDLPVLTLWEILEDLFEEDSEWTTLTLSDGGGNVTSEELEQMKLEREEVQRRQAQKLIPLHAALLQRIIDGTASDKDLTQCVELCRRIEWGKDDEEDE